MTPRYDFKCEFCMTQVELVLAVDQQVPKCAGCMGKLVRLWSSVPIHFKGDGWAGKS
jgi:putative FmdB family regulatory protein